jgi:hypothetical protein
MNTTTFGGHRIESIREISRIFREQSQPYACWKANIAHRSDGFAFKTRGVKFTGITPDELHVLCNGDGAPRACEAMLDGLEEELESYEMECDIARACWNRMDKMCDAEKALQFLLWEDEEAEAEDRRHLL